MMNKINSKYFEVDFKGIKNNYSRKKFLNSLIYPVITSIILLIIVVFTKTNVIGLLLHLNKIMFNIFPSIIGFGIASFAFIISLSNKKFLEKIKIYNDKPSYYQILIAVFSVTLIAFIISMVFITFIEIFSVIPPPDFLNPNLLMFFNYFILFLLFIIICYNFFQLLQIILNIFNFTQVYQVSVYKDISDDTNTTTNTKRNQ